MARKSLWQYAMEYPGNMLQHRLEIRVKVLDAVEELFIQTKVREAGNDAARLEESGITSELLQDLPRGGIVAREEWVAEIIADKVKRHVIEALRHTRAFYRESAFKARSKAHGKTNQTP